MEIKKKLSLVVASFLVVSSVFAVPTINIPNAEIKFGGLAKSPKAYKIQNGEHQVFTNVYIKDENIRVVKGRERLNTTAHTDTVVNGVWYYESSSGTQKLVVRESDELVSYNLDGTNRTQLAASLTNENASAVQIGDNLYVTSATDGIYKWTGTGSATALGSVSAPSSVDFSATTGDGGMTPGLDAVVLPDFGTDSSGNSQYAVTDSTCDDRFTEILDFEEEDTACGSLANFITECATSTTYQYKVTKYSTKTGIESEASSADSATLSGANSVSVVPTGIFRLYSDSGCSTLRTSSPYYGAKGIETTITGEQTRTSGTLASAPSAPFDTYRVYRTVAGGSDYFLVGEQSTGAFTDGTPDASLLNNLDTTIDTISPPSFPFIEEYKGVLFVAEGNSLRFNHVPVEASTSIDTYWLETDEIIIGTKGYQASGLKATNNSLLIFTVGSIQELTGFGVGSFRLTSLVDGVGAVSNDAIEIDSQGDIIFFAGRQGVYKLRTFKQPTDDLTGARVDQTRVSLIKISSPNLDPIFELEDNDIQLTESDYANAHAYYDFNEDLYFLYIGDDCFIFNNRDSSWTHVPASNFSGSVFAKGTLEGGTGYIIDNLGFTYENWKGYTLGESSGTITGNPTSSTSTTLTDSGASFNITDSGLTGQWVIVDTGGTLQYRQISSNTGTAITVSSAWDSNPTTSSTYYIAYIVADWKTKQYELAELAPGETRVQDFFLLHEKSDASQDLTISYYADKSATAKGSFTVDLATNFIDKVGSLMRSPWVQWGFRSFISNSSDTISPPIDISGYAFKATGKEVM